MDKIQITLTTPVLSQEDQTPTPTKLFKLGEEIGLFNDLQDNPFDQTFKKAVDTQCSLLKYPLSVQNPEETLNTPTPFQTADVDANKVTGTTEALSLVLEKEHPLDPAQEILNTVYKSSRQRSPLSQPIIPSSDVLPDENGKNKSDTLLQPDLIRYPSDVCSAKSQLGPDIIIKEGKDQRNIDIISNLVSSKLIPVKSKQINSTSELIKKKILNKKNNLLLIEGLEIPNPIKSYQSAPVDLLTRLPVDILKVTPSPSVPELEITPIPSPGSVKLPLPRKQSSDDPPPPPEKKKSREISEEEKRKQILERNRLAAKRSREKQKKQQHALEHKLREKEKENKQLKLENQSLKLKLLAKEEAIDQLAKIKAQAMLRALGHT